MVNRDKLLNEYVLEMVEGMDTATLVSYAIDALRAELDRLYTTDELVAEVQEYYPHLLEEE